MWRCSSHVHIKVIVCSTVAKHSKENAQIQKHDRQERTHTNTHIQTHTIWTKRNVLWWMCEHWVRDLKRVWGEFLNSCIISTSSRQQTNSISAENLSSYITSKQTVKLNLRVKYLKDCLWMGLNGFYTF